MQSALQRRDPWGSFPAAKDVAEPPPTVLVLQLTPPSEEDCRGMLDL